MKLGEPFTLYVYSTDQDGSTRTHVGEGVVVTDVSAPRGYDAIAFMKLASWERI